MTLLMIGVFRGDGSQISGRAGIREIEAMDMS
jgi:hypothetical protein